MPISSVASDKIPPSPNPFSLGIKANGFLFVSGQVGKDSSGKILEGFTNQVTQTMENLKTVIEAGGSGMDKVVKIVIYLTDISKLPQLNPIYKSYFSEILPARATVEVSRLGSTAEVEIDAIALIE
jgi:2-iminobutanoate/2-iminopropanoate deaminase